MWWLLCLASCAIGIYYLLCTFIPSLRLGEGHWDYHITLATFLWMLPKSPKSLNGFPVSRASYLMTSLSFLAIGVAGSMNHFDRLSDNTVSWIGAVSLLAAGLAVGIDWRNVPSKGDSDPPVV